MQRVVPWEKTRLPRVRAPFRQKWNNLFERHPEWLSVDDAEQRRHRVGSPLSKKLDTLTCWTLAEALSHPNGVDCRIRSPFPLSTTIGSGTGSPPEQPVNSSIRELR